MAQKTGPGHGDGIEPLSFFLGLVIGIIAGLMLASIWL